MGVCEHVLKALCGLRVFGNSSSVITRIPRAASVDLTFRSQSVQNILEVAPSAIRSTL